MEDGGWWFIIILIVIAFFLLKGTAPPSLGQINNMTSYLDSLGVIYYYSSSNCPYCIIQESYFNFSNYTNKVDVISNSTKNIQAVPAWEYHDNISYGIMDYKQLSQKYGFTG